MKPLPTDEQLAVLLGLKNWGLTANEVHSLWRARVYPSFDLPWVLAGMFAESFPPEPDLTAMFADSVPPAEDEPDVEEGTIAIALDEIDLVEPSNSGPLWHRAVLATETNSVVLALESDPVSKALNQLELCRAERDSTLDGITYELRVETRSLCGEFVLSNPYAPSLRRLEAALLEIAKQASAAPDGHWAQELVQVWLNYTAR